MMRTGLLDRTHLRWFTVDTMRQALRAAGLQPVDVVPRRFDVAAAEAFATAMTPALQRLGLDPAEYVQRCGPLQHVWRAQRQPAAQIFLASTILDPVGGVSEVRVAQPMRALLSEPGLLPRLARLDAPPVPPADMARIFVLHRPLLTGEAGLSVVRDLIRQGWMVVCEFDDHPNFISASRHPDILNFRAVHAVQTSTEPLAEVLRSHNPEVAVFPNAVACLSNPRNHTDPTRQTLFFGGLNRERDWPPFLPGLNAAAAKAGARLRFRIVADRALFDALDTPHKEFYPLCNYETYLALLSECEISFMPLADTSFNRCKSDLKFLEAAAHRVTALASPTVYADTLKDGENGLLVRDAHELQQRLLRLVASPELGLVMGDAARSYVATHRMLAYQNVRRSAWYRSLWARRVALHQSLVARVPALQSQSAAA